VLAIAPDAQVTVLPNGVNTDRFKGESQLAPHTSLKAGDEEILIGFVGRVRPWHGLDGLIDAFADVARARSDVRLCVVGNTDGVTEELVERLRQHDIEDRVTLTGEMAAGDMPEVIAGLDVVVAPYPATDNFYFSPLKVFEYMAAGKAIVASNIGQIPDILEHGRTALLYEAGDTGALADSLLNAVKDDELREQLGLNARAEAVANHTWRHRAQVFSSVIGELTANSLVAQRTPGA
jgi:glycosyltransferase involved in cell wall biosynthesis